MKAHRVTISIVAICPDEATGRAFAVTIAEAAKAMAECADLSGEVTARLEAGEVPEEVSGERVGIHADAN